MQHILICIQTNKTVNDDDVLEFGTDEFYVKSTDEMYELFSAWPEACENTNRIAEMCSFDFEFGVTKLPYFVAPDGMDNKEYFVKLCRDGLLAAVRCGRAGGYTRPAGLRDIHYWTAWGISTII